MPEIGQAISLYRITGKTRTDRTDKVNRMRDGDLIRAIPIMAPPGGFANDNERIPPCRRATRGPALLDEPGIASIYGLIFRS